MICRKCENVLSDESKFCNKCGSLVADLCSRCRAVLDDGSLFCNKCGEKVLNSSSEQQNDDKEKKKKGDTYRFKEICKLDQDKKRSKLTSGLLGGGILTGGTTALVMAIETAPAWLSWLPWVAPMTLNPAGMAIAITIVGVGGVALFVKEWNDWQNNKSAATYAPKGLVRDNAELAAQVVFIPVIFFLKRMEQLDYWTPELIKDLKKSYVFSEESATSFVAEYSSKTEEELMDLMQRLDPQKKGLENLSFFIPRAIKECYKFRDWIGKDKSKADACIKEIQAVLCKGIDWTKLETAYITILISTVIPAVIFLRENNDGPNLSNEKLKDELRNLGIEDEDILENLVVKYSIGDIRKKQEQLIRILVNNLVHDPGTIESKNELFELPTTIANTAKETCLQLSEKFFEERLWLRNKEYIMQEQAKLEKFIRKELHENSDGLVSVVQQTAGINVEYTTALQDLVDQLDTYNRKRDEELLAYINEVKKEREKESDDTGLIIDKNNQDIMKMNSHLDEILIQTQRSKL